MATIYDTDTESAPTIETLQQCVDQLNQSERGRSAMRHLLTWLDGDGLGLDAINKVAVLNLLEAAWHDRPMEARDLMRAALGGGSWSLRRLPNT